MATRSAVHEQDDKTPCVNWPLHQSLAFIRVVIKWHVIPHWRKRKEMQGQNYKYRLGGASQITYISYFGGGPNYISRHSGAAQITYDVWGPKL